MQNKRRHSNRTAVFENAGDRGVGMCWNAALIIFVRSWRQLHGQEKHREIYPDRSSNEFSLGN